MFRILRSVYVHTILSTAKDLRVSFVGDMIPGVYVMTNFSGSVLYIGASTVLPDRIRLHQQETLPGFTKRYHCTKLIYFEICESRDAAYRREKEMKGWTRVKKEVAKYS